MRGLIIVALPHHGPLRNSSEDIACQILRDNGFATLIVSLLTPYEATRDPDTVFDVSLLNSRLQASVGGVARQPELEQLPLGLLCAGTSASAAIRSLAQAPSQLHALVCRAARIDLAGAEPLKRLQKPILLLMPQDNAALRAPATAAYALIAAPRAWQDFAGEDFSQPQTLAASMHAASDWFGQHLPPRASAPVQDEAPSDPLAG